MSDADKIRNSGTQQCIIVVKISGFLGSMFSGLQFLSSPLLGALSDVCGRKPIIILSVAGTLVSYLVWSRATTFTLFVLSRIIGGLSKASVSISTAIVSDIYAPKIIGKGMALIGVAFSVGFVVGPVFGAYFAQTAKTVADGELFFVTPARFAIMLTLIELLIILTLLPETLEQKKQKIKSANIARNAMVYVNPSALFGFAALKDSVPAAELEKLQIYGEAYFAYLFLYSGLEFTLSFLTRLRFQYDSTIIGINTYCFRQHPSSFCQTYTTKFEKIFLGGLVRRLPSAKHLKFASHGIWMIIPAFMIIGLSHSVLMLYIGISLYSIASGIVVPCLTSRVSNLSSPNSKGTTLGVFRSLGALARAVGPIFSSAAFWLVGPEISYTIGGLLLIKPIILLNQIRKDALKAE
ncbi:unnamed protein product [Enterobius vermicularis]|uniref:MFS domain-containing protein n=1 Tax=Enterobius vermicularis TaxID=51028 RepID=A0A0N4V6U5_ENTVE|nr:unnamed protein product [Enterobius vermicularis]